MKDAMIDMMVSMMPFMKPFMWTGVAVAVLALVLIAVSMILKSDMQKVILWSGRIVLAVAIFFVSAQLAGYFLNMPPAINFGDSSKFEFILVSFWQIGLGFFAVAAIIKFANRPQKTTAG